MEQFLSSSNLSDESPRNLIRKSLDQLRCHFTWELAIEDVNMPDLERRVSETEFPYTNGSTEMHNLLAFIRHLKGLTKEALQILREAEASIQTEQVGKRSLVTWGNCAWVHYHMGSLAEAQTYLAKVENACKEYGSCFPYRMECAEMDYEEGWALLKCGGKNYKRAMACFAKAVKEEPENPEYSIGYAVAAYRQDRNEPSISLEPLKKAVRLNPEDPYIKVLLALKLQDLDKPDEARMYIEEALGRISSQPYIFAYVGKFYRRKGSVDKALECFEQALKANPFSAFVHHQIGLCHKTQLIQIKEATNMRPRGQDRERADQAIHLAKCHFQKTLKLKPTYEMAYINLAEMCIESSQFEEAEENFQKALSLRDLDDHIQQEIHLRYGQFQQFYNKSEDRAISHYLKGLKIEVSSISRNKLLKALEKLAERRIHQNVRIVESNSLLGFVYRLKGEMSKALLCYEKALRLTKALNPEF